MKSKTPYIAMRGIYAPDQVDTYVRCLRALKGKTNRAVFYLRSRKTRSHFLHDIADVASECGITVTPGVELSSFLIDGEWHGPLGDADHPVTWDMLWRTERWERLAVFARMVCEVFGVRDFAFIGEPATNYIYNPAGPPADVNWRNVYACLRKIHDAKIIPWFDLPIIWAGAWKPTCEAYIRATVNAFRPARLFPPRARWMCIYNRAFPVPRQRHIDMVGSRKFHDRLACKLIHDVNYPYDIEGVREYLRTNDRGVPPVLYIHSGHDGEHSVRFCEEL